MYILYTYLTKRYIEKSVGHPNTETLAVMLVEIGWLMYFILFFARKFTFSQGVELEEFQGCSFIANVISEYSPLQISAASCPAIK